MITNKVIIIEDDDIHYFILSKLLKDIGYSQDQITRCSRLDDIYNVDVAEVSFVFSDLVLPDAKRGTTFDTVQAWFRNKPVIVLTSSYGEELANETKQRGAKEYLIKGKISADILQKAISNALGSFESFGVC